MKHTPGPWKQHSISKHHIISGDEPNQTPITIVVGVKEYLANAELIAKAPDMALELERLKAVNAELLDSLHKVVGESEYALRYKHGEDVETLRKALANIIVLCAEPIAKSEGRA